MGAGENDSASLKRLFVMLVASSRRFEASSRPGMLPPLPRLICEQTWFSLQMGSEYTISLAMHADGIVMAGCEQF
jgi:hypothetical protein